MGESRYNKFLTVLLIVIIIVVIGLLGYLGYDYYKNYKTTDDANKFVSTFIEENTETSESEKDSGESGGSISSEIQTAEISSSSSSKKTQYKGFDVIGTIKIPKTNIEYPILNDPPTIKKLEVAVAALYPKDAEVNKPGNIVIVGHNYRNSTFFSNNKKLSNGDKIYITGLDGNTVTYVIYSVFETTQNDTEFYNRDTDGAMEITLSTCTDASNDRRTIIQARAE